MKDLLCLAEIFGLKVVKKFRGHLPSITIEKDDGEIVMLQKSPHGTIYATDKIPNVPMNFIGNGGWRFAVDL